MLTRRCQRNDWVLLAIAIVLIMTLGEVAFAGKKQSTHGKSKQKGGKTQVVLKVEKNHVGIAVTGVVEGGCVVTTPKCRPRHQLRRRPRRGRPIYCPSPRKPQFPGHHRGTPGQKSRMSFETRKRLGISELAKIQQQRTYLQTSKGNRHVRRSTGNRHVR